MSIIVNNISYLLSNKEVLFSDINFTLNYKQKAALIGKNGSGKSTLLQIIAGALSPSSGEIIINEKPYYLPQHLGQYDEYTIAHALKIFSKLKALHTILKGEGSEEDFTILDDEWDIEQKALSSLSEWDIPYTDLYMKMKHLSGGEKTKVFLAGMALYSTPYILMDEPSNHLDKNSRQKLYEFICNSKSSLLVTSHDRTLLNLLNSTYELNKNQIMVYGGNYDFYKKQKEEELNSLTSQLSEGKKMLRLARKTAIETMEKRQKRDAKKNKKEGIPKIILNNLKNKAELSTSKLKDVHTEKIEKISKDIKQIRRNIPDMRKLKMNFDNSELHKGKILVNAENINFGYLSHLLWAKPLNFKIISGDRVAIQGDNGSGKSTLVQLILGKIRPLKGDLKCAQFSYLYMDQEYSILEPELTVWKQTQKFNERNLEEYELKAILNRYLFNSAFWDRKCVQLSGGEKIRLIFCCLMIQNQIPDMFILDEPTNNLDINSLEIITTTLSNYEGTIIVISHDDYFLNEINVTQFIEL